jgi:hypothetical protein
MCARIALITFSSLSNGRWRQCRAGPNRLGSASKNVGLSSASTRFIRSAYKISASAKWQTTSRIDHFPSIGRASRSILVEARRTSRSCCAPSLYMSMSAEGLDMRHRNLELIVRPLCGEDYLLSSFFTRMLRKATGSWWPQKPRWPVVREAPGWARPSRGLSRTSARFTSSVL